MTDTRNCLICSDAFLAVPGLHYVCRLCLAAPPAVLRRLVEDPRPLLRRPSWPLLGLRGLIASGMAVVLLCACGPSPQSQADLTRLGGVVAAAHGAGLRSPEEIGEDLAALQRLGVAVSSSETRASAMRMLESAWNVLGPMLPSLFATGGAP